MSLQIRREQPGDEKAVFDVHFRAFERDAEPKVVDALRKNCPEGISIVAEQDGTIVGHILFTPAWIGSGFDQTEGMGLGPLAVQPEHQRKGIGSALVRFGLEELRQAGILFVVVVGQPGFYPKFGFERASKYALRCEYDQVPDEAFMIMVFRPADFQGVHGVAFERPEFAAAI